MAPWPDAGQCVVTGGPCGQHFMGAALLLPFLQRPNFPLCSQARQCLLYLCPVPDSLDLWVHRPAYMAQSLTNGPDSVSLNGPQLSRGCLAAASSSAHLSQRSSRVIEQGYSGMVAGHVKDTQSMICDKPPGLTHRLSCSKGSCHSSRTEARQFQRWRTPPHSAGCHL